MAVIRRSPPASALARLVAAMALLAALLPVVDTRLAQPGAALAASFVVNLASDPGDGTCDLTCTLRDAILNANTLAGHDTITFSSTVTTPIVLGSALPIVAEALTIDGTGQAITVDGVNLYRPFQATAPLTLTALTIQRGRAAGGFGGGGAYFSSAGTLWGVSFISNTATGEGGGGAYFATTAMLSGAVFISNTVTNGHGGGAYVGGAAVVTDTAFMTNTTNFHGGGLYVLASSTIVGSTFISNTANASGGGAYLFGAATVTGSTFIRNRAAVDFNASGGGASFSGAATLVNSTFMSNTAFLDGGGVKFWAAGAISDSTFTGNSAGYGGGAHLAEGGGVTNTTFVSNTALADGGGLYLSSFVAGASPLGGGIAPISGATFTGNTATTGAGGGAYLGGSSNIHDTTFTGNSAATSGGGVAAQASTVVSETEFISNTAASGGGGSFGGAAILLGGFYSNTATGSGGGAQFFGVVVMVDTTLAGNTAGGNGGGANFGASSVLTRTTFSLNQTTGFSTRGGGAHFGGAAAISETNFISNTAANGNGGGFAGRVVTMTDTIIMGNQALCEDAPLSQPALVTGPPADCGDGGGADLDAAYAQAFADWGQIKFEGNTAERNGGGLYTRGVTDNGLSIAGIVFEDNTAGEKGGAAYLDDSNIHFSQLGVTENGSVDEAAIFLDGSFARMLNAEFSRNEVTNPDGAADIGMSYEGSTLDAKHVTFVPRFTGFQLAVSVGTDLPDEDGQQETVANLTNIIFHGYDVGVRGQAPTSTVAMTGVLWSNVTTPWQVGNFNVQFQYTGDAASVDEDGGDYHLTATSAAIDRGVATDVTTDLDGEPRPQGLAPDLGAYEYVQFGFSKIYLPYIVKGD